MFRIDFIMSKTTDPAYGQVVYSIVDTASKLMVLDMSLSGEKLSGSTNYVREPRRCEFEVLIDAWIQAQILSGNNEHVRMISIYYVKVYRESNLIFTGVIDTSQIEYDINMQIIRFHCYDFLKLLVLWNDLTQLYSLSAGYNPYWILQYYVNKINAAINVSIGTTSNMVIPSHIVEWDNPLELATIDYADMLELPYDGGEHTYSIHDGFHVYDSPVYGWLLDAATGTVKFIYHYLVVIKSVAPGGSIMMKLRSRARLLKYWNYICPVIEEYDDETDWFEYGSSSVNLQEAITNIQEFFEDAGTSSIQANSLLDTAVLGNRTYTSAESDHIIRMSFAGNIYTDKLFPGAFYLYENEQTNCMKVLQAMLLMYNATVYCESSGRIVLASKAQTSSNVILIPDADVVSATIGRLTQEVPETSVIDVLAGDTTILQEIVAGDLTAYHDSKWVLNAVIDRLDARVLRLFDIITVKGNNYYIVEVETDFVNDEYRVVAWQI